MSIKNKDNLIIGIILIPIILFALLPILQSGLWADDALNSLIKPGLDFYEVPLLEFSNKVVFHWWTSEGRPMIMFYLGYFLFYILEKIEYIKLFNIFLILISFSLYIYYLKQIKVEFAFSLLSIFFFFTLYQTNINANDPLCSFSFLYPIIFIQIFILLILLDHWKKTNNSRIILAISLLWFIFLLSYEMVIIFFPLAILIIYYSKADKKNLAYAGILISLIFFLILKIYLKINMTGGGYVGTQFGLISRYPTAYFNQLLSTLPLISYLVSNTTEYNLTKIVFDLLSWKNLLIIIFVFFFLNNALNVCKNKEHKNKLLFYIALILLFIPPIFPAISLKYQNALSLGNPSIQIYFQYFGLSILLSFLFLKTNNKSVSILIKNIIIILISVFFTMNSLINLNTVNGVNGFWKLPRDEFIKNINNILPADIKEDDIIFFENTPKYVNEILLYQVTNKRFYNEFGDHFWYKRLPRPNANKYKIKYNSISKTYSIEKIID